MFSMFYCAYNMGLGDFQITAFSLYLQFMQHPNFLGSVDVNTSKQKSKRKFL